MKNKNFFRSPLFFSLVSTTLALVVHAYLALKYYQLKFGASAGGMSSCNINTLLNCDATAASSYAHVLGIPLAVWGFSTNLVLLFLTLVGAWGMCERPPRVLRFAFLLSLVVAGASVVMGVISASLLNTFCLYCIAAYVLSFVSLFGLWRTKEKPDFWAQEMAAVLRDDKWLVATLLSPLVFAFVFHSSLVKQYGFRDLDRFVQERMAAWMAAPVQNFDSSEGLRHESKEKPRLTIVEFADFLCPHCKHAYPTLDAFARANSDVELVFKTFPLDGSCNPDPGMNGQGDGVRCRLALSVICAEKLFKKGWDVHHYIFDEQENFYSLRDTTALDQKICTGTGVNCSELKTCLESEEALTSLKKQAQEGIQAKIGGTPTIFVNGRLLHEGQVLPVLQEAYRRTTSPADGVK